MLTNIETERVRKGLTQEQIASQLGVSHKTYYNWINEKKDIPSQKLKKMSQMFKTNMEYLLGEEQKRVLYLCDGNVPTCKKIHVTKIQRERVIVHHVLIQKMWHML